MHRKSSKLLRLLPPRPRLLLLVTISMAALAPLLLLLLFLSSSSSSSPSFQAPTFPSPPLLLLHACNATRFPSLCLSSLSSSSSSSLPPSPTPLDVVLSSISISSQSISPAISISQTILSTSSNRKLSTAARDCISHLSLSSTRLSRAFSSLPRAPVPASAWAAAALQYQYDCWSALKYVNTTHQVSKAMSFIYNLISLTSNALALISAFRRAGADVSLWSPPVTERDGHWDDDDGGGGSAQNWNPMSLRSSGGVPRNLEANVTVCKSAQCQLQSVQAAISAAPDHSTTRFVIRVAAGIYDEIVRVPFEKANLVLIGDGIGRTVITNSLNVAKMPGVTTYNSATFGVDGDGFMAANLTFENTAGVGAHQAVAFRSDSDLSVLESVEFSGHQDTLYARSLRQFYKNCKISGTIDFIFGNAAAVFQDCMILIVPRLGMPEKGESNAVTAHGRIDPAQPTGFVLLGCVVNGSEAYMTLYHKKPRVHRNYLGRPWKEFARTVFVDCVLGEIVTPEGWMPFRGELGLGTLFYGEFGCSGPGANVTMRVPWSSRIPAQHVGAYSVKMFIQGDEWIPALDDSR